MRSVLRLVLPALFPSWAFFDQITASPRIEVRGHGGAWHRLRPRPSSLTAKSLFFSIFYNNGWNEKLFLTSCAERLLDSENAHFQQEILERAWSTYPNAKLIDLRIVLISRSEKGLNREVVYEATARRS